MKKGHYIFINMFFISLILLSAGVVYQFMTGNKPLEALSGLGREPQKVQVVTNECSDKDPLTITGTNNPQLRKLATYQQACRSFITDTMMVFMSMPNDQASAIALAQQDAETYKAFAAVQVRPLVIYEPSTIEGELLDYQFFANGTYNKAIETYFAELKKLGITDKQLGIINPFPEANLPYWSNNQPQFFAPAVNNYLTIARAAYPKVETSILLNSATYDRSDFNWENSDYNSLLAYAKGIKPGLVDYAGMQGFPWISRAGGNGIIFNAAEFLNPELLIELADYLKTKKTWFNTATFSEKYTLDPALLRVIPEVQRKEVMMTIREQAIEMKTKGYDMAVNIFAEDKSDQTEETNWSYWDDGKPFESLHAPILTEFVRDMHNESIDFWLFDR